MTMRTTSQDSYMFHAHVSEFAELGWMSTFDLQDGGGA